MTATDTPPKTPAAEVPVKAAAPDTTVIPKLGDAPPADDDVPPLGAVPPVEEPAAPVAKEAEPAKEEKKPDEAPIEYKFDVEEGQRPYAQPVIDAYTAILQKHKVSAEAAKELLAGVMPAVNADINEQIAAYQAQRESEWLGELRQRHGPQLKNMADANNRWLHSAEAPPGLLKLFTESPALSRNPDVFDLLTFVRQRVANDRGVTSTSDPKAPPMDPLRAMAADYEARQEAAKAAARG